MMWQSWLPLVAAIAIVYKATKVPKITAVNFLKEVVILFGSIVVFMAVTAVSTVGAMIYNLVTHLGGGIEVTLRETD